MSKIPDTPKTKYNHNDPFRWVDSQWEKYMTEQKEHKAMIKQLREDLGTCTKNYQFQRRQLEKERMIKDGWEYLLDEEGNVIETPQDIAKETPSEEDIDTNDDNTNETEENNEEN